jgi:hypothetical protein
MSILSVKRWAAQARDRPCDSLLPWLVALIGHRCHANRKLKTDRDAAGVCGRDGVPDADNYRGNCIKLYV